MSRVSVRDLRTRFPAVREAIEREGEVIVTERGKPAFVLRAYQAEPQPKTKPLDCYARLVARMPKPLTEEESHLLDEANRGDR